MKFELLYKYKLLNLTIAILWLSFLVGLTLYFVPTTSCLIPCAILLWVINIPITIRGGNKEYLITNDNTIEYHRLGASFEVNWNDIEKISYRSYLYTRQECLVTDQSKLKIKSMSFWGSWYELNSGNNTSIPISCFAENWRDSELGQQIKQYAPHLFEKEKSA